MKPNILVFVGILHYFICRQHDQEGYSAVFTATILIVAWWWFNFHPRRVVASLQKALYDDYLCKMASN